MIRKISLVLSLAFLLAIFPQQLPLAQGSAPTENDSGAIVCPPGIYTPDHQDCMTTGPSHNLSELAKVGLSFPARPLPAFRIPLELSYLPYSYFKVEESGTFVYPSLEQAMAGGASGQSLAPGFTYVSYLSRTDTGAGIYYLLRSGNWIPGKGSRISHSSFRGMAFSSSPGNSFGWVLSEAPVVSAPGYASPQTGQIYRRFNIVQIYDVQNKNGMDWFKIGVEQWLESRLVGAVIVNTTPPDGVENGRWIDVNLAEQTLAVYDNNRLVFATLISTGVEPFWTQPGLFPIYEMKETETMSGSFEADRSDFYYLEDVPWTLYYDQARAIHATYWHTYFGYPQSRGCVNLSVADSNWVFHWANEGDWVYVHDPSGRTPTDPAIYGAGAP